MFTSGQISDMLSIPPSTLRRYVKQFVEHLSKDATKKRGRRFTERDVAVLARARELIQQGRSPEEVTSLLQVVGDEEEKPEDSASALDLVPSISRALTEAVDTARALRTDVEDLAGDVAEIAKAQGASEDELRALREWMRQPWWRRLFGQPPEEQGDGRGGD